VLDPVSNMQVPVTSNFYFMICMLAFITVNAHHSIIRAIYNSYALIPMGGVAVVQGAGAAGLGAEEVVSGVSAALMERVMRLFADVFAVGFQVAAPIIFMVFLADVALGIISKAMPQINVFMVGLPLKILVGLVIVIVSMPAVLMFLGNLFSNIEGETLGFMQDFGGV